MPQQEKTEDFLSPVPVGGSVTQRYVILSRKKDGDWYIYPQFLAHENFKNVHKKVQKGYKIFKPTIHNVLSTGTNVVKIWLSLCLIRCVRFSRYCGKMYSRHLFSSLFQALGQPGTGYLFSYGGLERVGSISAAPVNVTFLPREGRSTCSLPKRRLVIEPNSRVDLCL